MKKFLLYVVMALLAHVYASAQLITLSVKSASLRAVMSDISKQTGYPYFMDPELADSTMPVTVEFKDKPLDQALQEVLVNQPYIYQLKNNTMLLVRKREFRIRQLIDSMVLNTEDTLRGTVLNTQGKPVIGATVRVNGIQYRGAYVNNKGEFSIPNAPPKGIITISNIGYETFESPYSRDTALIFYLKPISYELDEKVVEAYHGTTKELTTSSTVEIKMNAFDPQSVSNILTTLSANVSGVYVTPGSGVVGSFMKVSIRGINTITSGTEPLYVVDGNIMPSSTLSQVPSATFGGISPIAGLRPSNIESIHIFKDADATAIYGSRAANGVIYFVTKKGEANKTKFDVDISSGISTVSRNLDLLNTSQYLWMRKMAFENDKLGIGKTDYDLNGTWDTTRYTNWQKKLIGGQAKFTDVGATYYYSKKQLQFMLGGGYRKEHTVYPGDFSNENVAAHFNLGHSFLDNIIQVTIRGSYTHNLYQLPVTDFANLVYASPDAPQVTNDKGQINWMDNTFDNPWAKLYQQSSSIAENLMGNVLLSINPSRNFQIVGSWGYNSNKLSEHSNIPLISIRPDPGISSKQREAVIGLNQAKAVIFEPQVNYSFYQNSHSLQALIGLTFQNETKSGSLFSASDFTSDIEMNNLAAATNLTKSFTYTQYRYNAIFARLGYNYNRKYIINLTGRRDGSSRFGPGKQFGNFGAIGIGWIFTKEEAIHNTLSFLKFGKLRASVGKTGNDQFLDYQYLNIYVPNVGYPGIPGNSPAQLINPLYSWETIEKIDFALDLGFFKNQFLVTINAYVNHTTNPLLGQSLPTATGFSTVMANVPAKIRNSGFEFDLMLRNIVVQSFAFNSSLNFTLPKNKLVYFKDMAHTDYWNKLTLGQPITNRMVYQYNGIDQETGIYTFGDLDEQGLLKRVSIKVGKQFFGGFRNSITYRKALSLDFLFQFVKQSGFGFFGVTAPGKLLEPGSNTSQESLNSWQKTNDKAKHQKFSTTQQAEEGFTNYTNSDKAYVDASFIRLKSISLSYTLPKVNPKGRLKRSQFQSAKVFIEGQNLFTITDFKGFDPEIQQPGINKSPLPTLKTISLGIKASF